MTLTETSGIRPAEQPQPGALPDLHAARAWRVLEFGLEGTILCSFFSISLMQICLGLALLSWFWLRFKGRAQGSLPLLAPLAAFALVSTASALGAEERAKALGSLSEVLTPLALCATVDLIRKRGSAQRLLRMLAIGAGLAAAVGLVQSARHGTEYRIHGTLGHYMTYAGVLSLAICPVLAELLFGALARRALVLRALSATLCAAALALTQTRSAWLGVAAAAVMLLFFWRKWTLLCLPVLAVLGYMLAPTPVQQRVQSFVDWEDITANERVFMWRGGLLVAQAYPLLGVGPDNLRAVFPRFKVQDDPWQMDRKWSHLHNNPLQVLAERGVLGLLAWLWIWCAWLRLAWRSPARSRAAEPASRTLLLGSLAALLAFHLAGLFEYSFGNSEIITLAWIILALPLAAETRSAEPSPQPLS